MSVLGDPYGPSQPVCGVGPDFMIQKLIELGYDKWAWACMQLHVNEILLFH